jgi:peptidoglycan/LPS O-acetylase OafA/YrhL
MIVGGCGVLLLAEHSRAREWLEWPVPRYLGRVSYSVYLLHGTVLQVTLIVLYGRVPVVVLGSVFLVGAMVAAHAFCVWVEEPSSRLGRRLTRGKTRPREEHVREAAVA